MPMRLRTLTSAALTPFAARALHAQRAPDLTLYLIADRNAGIAFVATERYGARQGGEQTLDRFQAYLLATA